MPVALISISTSPAFGPSSCTVSIASARPASNAIAAFTSMLRTPDPAAASTLRAQVSRLRTRIYSFRAPDAFALWVAMRSMSGGDRLHLGRVKARLNDRGDECRKLRWRPARVWRQFSMDEIQTVERMAFIFDSAVEMHPAAFAGVTLDS